MKRSRCIIAGILRAMGLRKAFSENYIRTAGKYTLSAFV